MPTLFLMLGYPGAGKTTAAQIISELTGATLLSSDKIRLEMFPRPTFNQFEHDELYAAIDSKTEEFLSRGKDVIYDANLNRFVHRQQKYYICDRTNSRPMLVWLKTPREVSKTRAVHDSRSHLWPEGEAAETMFNRLADVFEPPHESEPNTELDGTKITKDYVKATLRF